jgi:hypothetical protein
MKAVPIAAGSALPVAGLEAFEGPADGDVIWAGEGVGTLEAQAPSSAETRKISVQWRITSRFSDDSTERRHAAVSTAEWRRVWSAPLSDA